MKVYDLIKKNRISVLIAVVILMQNPIWSFWKYGILIAYFVVFLLFVLKYKFYRYKISSLVAFISLMSIFVFCIFPIFNNIRLSSYFILFTYWIACSLSESEGAVTLRIITRFLAIVIAVSLPVWLLNVSLDLYQPIDSIDLSDVKGGQCIMNNYILYVTNADAGYFRFYSMFDEPGVLGTLSSFVLFGNRYNFKKWDNVVILIGGIFTYSLAFYVLTLLGYLYYSIHSIKRLLISILLCPLILFIVFQLLKDDLAFQYAIVDRFSDFGVENLDNRTGTGINTFFDHFILSSDAFWGMGTGYLQANGLQDGNSYKMFIIEYGLLGMVLLLLMYKSLIKKCDKSALVFYILFFLSFTQRPFAFTSWQLLLFTCVISSLSLYKRKLITCS